MASRTKLRRPILHREDWNRGQVFTTTAGPGGWAIYDVSSSGTPTYQIENVGGIPCARLLLDNTSEAQTVCLYQKDNLLIPLRRLRRAQMMLKILNANAVTTVLAGFASARNDTPDNVAVHSWFALFGAASLTALVAESDDGTTDKDDQTTGIVVGTDWMKLEWEFGGDAPPLGALLKPVKLSVNGVPVCQGVNFDLSGVSASQGVQPLIELKKASGTGTPEVCVGPLEYEYLSEV